MAETAEAPNGAAKVSRAEHESLRASVAELHKKVDHLSEQVGLIGRAMDLLLRAHGLDSGEDSDG